MKNGVKKIDKYSFNDPFGSITASVQMTYLDGEEYLDDSEIERLSLLTASQFESSNRILIKAGKRTLSEEELYHCLSFFKIQASELSQLLNIDKSVVSRQLKGESAVTASQSSFLLDLILEEVGERGFVQRKVRALKAALRDGGKLDEIGIEPRDVALLIVSKFSKHNAEVTKLKLQKLLYYVQGMGIALYNVKIFDEPLIAYRNGPVVESIYNLTKRYKDEDLAKIFSDNREIIEPDEIVKDVVDAVFERYGRMETWALVESTHSEKPWSKTKQSAAISDALMIAEFRGKYI